MENVDLYVLSSLGLGLNLGVFPREIDLSPIPLFFAMPWKKSHGNQELRPVLSLTKVDAFGEKAEKSDLDLLRRTSICNWPIGLASIFDK